MTLSTIQHSLNLEIDILAHIFIFTIISLPSADINECEENLDNCSENADCINYPGTFDCVCKDGFEGDGIFCESKLLRNNMAILMYKIYIYDNCNHGYNYCHNDN
jgi:hypothetical protein